MGYCQYLKVRYWMESGWGRNDGGVPILRITISNQKERREGGLKTKDAVLHPTHFWFENFTFYSLGYKQTF